MMLYKVTTADGDPTHGGSGRWPLPTDTEPGAWRTIDGDISPCRNGLHLATLRQLETWLVDDGMVWRAETDGDVIDAEEKMVASKVRLLPGPVPCYKVRAMLRVRSDMDRPHAPDAPYLATIRLPKGHTLSERQAETIATYQADLAAYDARLSAWYKTRERRDRKAWRDLQALLGDA